MKAMARPLVALATLALLAGCNVADLPPLPDGAAGGDEDASTTPDVAEEDATEDASPDADQDAAEDVPVEDAAADADEDATGDVPVDDAAADAVEDAADTAEDVAADAVDDAPTSLTCDQVGFEGCCLADGRVAFCEDDAVTIFDCADGCGWEDGAGFYDCDLPEQSAPSDEPPYLCPGETCVDTCAGMECGFDCGEACGTCGAGETCQAGVCVPD